MEQVSGPEKREFNFEGDHWVLPTQLEVIPAAGNELERRLVALGWSDEDIGDVRMAFSDLMANAIGHGNLGIEDLPEGVLMRDRIREKLAAGPSERRVTVELGLSSEEIGIAIEDQGRGFDYSRMQGLVDENRLLDTSGRGETLIRAAVDVRYEGRGNRVVLSKQRLTRNGSR